MHSPQGASAEHMHPYGQRVQEISRRSAVKAAAWSVPVIAVAAATPMAAASGPGRLTNVSATYQELPGQIIHVFANKNASAFPRPEHSVVSGTPVVHVVDALTYLDSDLIMELTVAPAIESDTQRTLTIDLPGFAPVTTPIF